MNTLQTIFSRVSTRDFSSELVSPEELNQVLLSGMAAPVGRGRYDTINLTVVTSLEVLNDIATAEDYSGTRPRAPLYGCKTLIIVSTKLSEKPDIEYSNVGCIIQTMALASRDLGLGSVYLWTCIANLKKHPEIVAKLNLPEGFTPISALGIGYSNSSLEEYIRPRHIINVNKVK